MTKYEVAWKISESQGQDVISWLISDRSLPDHLEDRKVLILVAPYPGLPGLFSENAQYLSELRFRHKEVWCQLTNVVSWKDWRIIEPTTTALENMKVKIGENLVEPASNFINKGKELAIEFDSLFNSIKKNWWIR